jgi:hypothetical protein
LSYPIDLFNQSTHSTYATYRLTLGHSMNLEPSTLNL